MTLQVPIIACIERSRLMSHSSNKSSGDIKHIQEVVKRIFPHESFYLRVLPEEGASFSPEVTVHTQLRQMQVKVAEVIYFEHYNELLQRSVMVTTEIKGQSMSQSSTLSQEEMEGILKEAGRDLACLNTVRVEGFGWVRRDSPEIRHLRAEWPAHRTFALEYWEADMVYLAKHVLRHSEVTLLEQVLSGYDSWLDSEQGYLAHGDFDTTQIYQENGRYTGIIDFGEIRGTDRWYDLGHFHMRFTGLLINVRALTRYLQKRPPNHFTPQQLDVLREDLVALL
jgi:aminoglycoside phosphotransferase (APT) family kinase protein